MESTKTIHLRPHHLLCITCFQNKGYSPEFITNLKKIKEKLETDQFNIKIVNGIDDICATCPENMGNGKCSKQELVTSLDEAHSKILRIKENEIITWKNIKIKLVKYMNLNNFNAACAKCSWKQLGICDKVVKNLFVLDPALMPSTIPLPQITK
jgi:uncharacterized protein